MRFMAIALVSSAVAFSAHAVTVGLGAGAPSPYEVIVKIDGRDTHIRLAGVKPSGDPAAATFLRCLITGRIVRITPAGSGTSKVTMLDGSVVAALVNEFFDT